MCVAPWLVGFLVFGGGPMLFSLLIAFIVFSWMPYARLTNSVVLRTRQEEYILATRSLGAGHLRLIFHHLIPNSISPAIVLAARDVGGQVLLQAGFTFINLSNQAAGFGSYVNPIVGYADFGPFPSNMTGRNTFRGPAYTSWSFSLRKTISFTERFKVDLRSDWTNLWNHRNFGNPTATMNSASFGANTTDPGGRTMLVSAKVRF